ncbi:HAMP domain-containing sensor histidine kinase [Micromonospora sp. NPDC000207]|uniref:sensor histidine kinase n=1 Tax=Micromonospora sp. NPDC000207 TaxID=3154246 RepID=UPI00332CCDD4
MRRAGLRTRVTAGFTAGALALSTAIALVSYQVTRSSLLAERERTAVRAAYLDATVVQAGLAADRPDILEILRSLDTGGNRRAMLHLDGEWYARNLDAGITDSIPAALQQLAQSGQPVVQRVRAGGQPALVVGVPLAPGTTFYEVDSLVELQNTLRVLAIVLTLVALSTAVAAASLGRHATGYVLRPLRRVTDAAQEITDGNLTARLDPTDEPDLARLTTSFNGMVDQLSARMQRDRRFAADVSHELRSPLQTLEAAASVLARRRDRLDQRTAVAVDLVNAEVARFQALVNDLIELARSDQPAERSPVDMVDLARQVCRTHQVSPEVVVAEEGAARVWEVDRRRVTQLLSNLVENALRHGGGPCAVRVGSEPDGHLLTVEDEGPGIRAEDREVIFDRFVRGRAAHVRGAGDGTGLGLALVAQHAAAHGGRVDVTDRPGGGARFQIHLPASPQ